MAGDQQALETSVHFNWQGGSDLFPFVDEQWGWSSLLPVQTLYWTSRPQHPFPSHFIFLENLPWEHPGHFWPIWNSHSPFHYCTTQLALKHQFVLSNILLNHPVITSVEIPNNPGRVGNWTSFSLQCRNISLLVQIAYCRFVRVWQIYVNRRQAQSVSNFNIVKKDHLTCPPGRTHLKNLLWGSPLSTLTTIFNPFYCQPTSHFRPWKKGYHPVWIIWRTRPDLVLD